MDETWLYYYDPDTKQHSMEWRHSGFARPKNSDEKIPLENSRLSFFGINTAFSSLTIFQSSKGPNYQRGVSSLLVQLKDILKEKRRGKVTNVILFSHEIAPAHRALATQMKLAYLDFHCLDHPLYSPDLAPSD